MLCSALWQTGVAGRPNEFFGPTLHEEFLSNERVLKVGDVRDYMEQCIDYSTTENGVFGTKLLANQTPVFLQKAVEHQNKFFDSLNNAIHAEFPNVQYIFLTRQNKIKQAISYYRALMTGDWYIIKDSRLPKEDRFVDYNHFRIQRCYQQVSMSERYWENYFRAHSISPLRISYEDLIENYSDTFRRVLAFLDLHSDVPLPEPRTTKIASKRSLEWEKEFLMHGRIPEYTAADDINIWALF
jgi:LPS sulfotransferase NodH